MLNDFLQMVSSNVKTNVKQQQIKDLAVYLKFFYKKYLQNLQHNVKRVYIFHLILVGIPSSMILSVKKRGVGGLLNRKNLLSVTKVIC